MVMMMYDDAQQESILIVFQHSQYKQQSIVGTRYELAGADLGGGCRGCAPPPGSEAFFFVFVFKICLPQQSVMSFLRGAPPPKKNPGSAPDLHHSVNYDVFNLILSLMVQLCYP